MRMRSPRPPLRRLRQAYALARTALSGGPVDDPADSRASLSWTVPHSRSEVGRWVVECRICRGAVARAANGTVCRPAAVADAENVYGLHPRYSSTRCVLAEPPWKCTQVDATMI
eukprot:scaffold3766_cov289-Prasinococcus_capsulatus_cf.AAC.3